MTPLRGTLKTIPPLVWVVPAALLVIATARLPYGYYTFTRIVTCGAAAWIAGVGFQEGPAVKAWSVALALVAVMFNPIFPIYLNRSTWLYIDLGASGVFVAHLFLVRLRVA